MSNPKKDGSQEPANRFGATCPTCSIALEEGFVADRGDHGGATLPEWVAGTPKSGMTGNLTMGGRRKKVYACRCPRCALVLFYAP